MFVGRQLRDCDSSRGSRGTAAPREQELREQHVAPQRASKRQLRDCSFDISRRISRYSHTSVTSRLNAAYHSMYFGAPFATPSSMKEKSSTRFSAATTT